MSPGLFNFYAEYIMRNAGLEDTQAGIKIVGRNINNLRYADDTTLMVEMESRLLGEISITSDMQRTPFLMVENEEELKSLLMKVKVES